MVNLNKNILRGVIITTYCLLITAIVYGISSVYSYLNTGADRSSMLHTEIKKIDQYLPKMVWSPINNEGRTIDEGTLKTIENDYLDAWYVKHIAYQTNTKTGLNDYYTESARKNLLNIIDYNTLEKIHIEATTLEHHPVIEFFSEDGQLAVITDKDVIEYKRVFKNKELVFETTEKSTYKIVFLLEDGFWRIRHMVKETSQEYKPETIPAKNSQFHISGINYYPKNTPWNMFGDQFSKATIANDFKIIKETGLNSIRVFVSYDDFGKANVYPEKIDKLKQVLDAATENQLKVVITLFDFYGDYSIINWTLNHKHAATIVNTFKNHEAIAGWDIKNEPNLDFNSRGKTNVISWLKQMLILVKTLDQNHPVTIGWSNIESASILKDYVDFISFHYYEDIEDLDNSIKALKTEHLNKPIVMGEFGMSSYKGLWNPFGNSEEDQTNYHKKAQEIIASNQLQFLSWTLYDFNNIPKEVVGRLPWRKNNQKHFGFINQSGDKKGAFNYISPH